jgi:hypothetical protein
MLNYVYEPFQQPPPELGTFGPEFRQSVLIAAALSVGHTGSDPAGIREAVAIAMALAFEVERYWPSDNAPGYKRRED